MSLHSYQPSPFFVLDEVDAALDNTNVAKIANYIRSHASDTFQFIVISLKGSLYERSNSLVGIYRDQDVNSSRTLTLDVSDVVMRAIMMADCRKISSRNTKANETSVFLPSTCTLYHTNSQSSIVHYDHILVVAVITIIRMNKHMKNDQIGSNADYRL